MVTKSLNLVTKPLNLVTKSLNLVTKPLNLVTKPLDLVTKLFNLVTNLLNLVTKSSLFQYLFLEPNADDPLNKAAASELQTNRRSFESNVVKAE